MLDYLVVGLGLAGISFCEQLEQNGKSYKLISDHSEQASLVAGGLYNPTILKRFTMAWEAHTQMQMALPFYERLEKKLGTTLDYKVSVLRRFASVEEQNQWFEAADKPGLTHYILPKVLENKNPAIEAPFGLGEVAQTGRIDTQELLKEYSRYLMDKDCLLEQTFLFKDLELHENFIQYQQLEARRLVFAEGYGLKRNPFFSYLPLNGTKGELLTIHAPDLKETSVIKSSVFIIPLGNDHYRIGATYKWKDKTSVPTAAAKEELLTKLKTFLNCDFKVVNHVAGVRPTVADRRPLVGQHPKHKLLYVLNGFGSRGVLIAPFASEQLFQAIENEGTIHQEMDVSRYDKLCT